MAGIESLLEIGALEELPGIQNHLVVDALLLSIVIERDIAQNSKTELLNSVFEGPKFENLRFVFKNRVQAIHCSFAKKWLDSIITCGEVAHSLK